jgi:hypothetical protein
MLKRLQGALEHATSEMKAFRKEWKAEQGNENATSGMSMLPASAPGETATREDLAREIEEAVRLSSQLCETPHSVTAKLPR